MSHVQFRSLATWVCFMTLAMVFVPRSAWHEHDFSDHHQHAEGKPAIESDCPVCDHVLPLAVKERVVPSAFYIGMTCLEAAPALPVVLLGCPWTTADRGPPQVG